MLSPEGGHPNVWLTGSASARLLEGCLHILQGYLPLNGLVWKRWMPRSKIQIPLGTFMIWVTLGTEVHSLGQMEALSYIAKICFWENWVSWSLSWPASESPSVENKQWLKESEGDFWGMQAWRGGSFGKENGLSWKENGSQSWGSKVEVV